MLKYFKIFTLLSFLTFIGHANAKPVPPGAGDGDVAANILFLIDSSASMSRWIGGDGLGSVSGAVYDSQDRIVIGQSHRRSRGGLIRYTAAGARDSDFMPVRNVSSNGCTVELENNSRTIANQRVRRVAQLKYLEGLTTNNNVIQNQNIIFAAGRDRGTREFILGFSDDGRDCLFAIKAPNGYSSGDFDIKTVSINGTDTPVLFMAGGRFGRRTDSYFQSCNLLTLLCETQLHTGNHITRQLARLSVNNDGSNIYFSNNNTGELIGHSISPTGNAFELGAETLRCSSTTNPVLTENMMHATAVEVSPNSNNIIYITSRFSHSLQKIDISNDTCSILTAIGTGMASNVSNEADPGALNADNVNFRSPWGLHIKGDHSSGETRILTGTGRGYVDEFNEDNFTEANRNQSWQQQFGGPRIRRWDGVKSAVNAVLNDSTLTTGAYFGFGHWNAGENGRGTRAPRGGRFCHRNDGCTYYDDWEGEHPLGRSSRCNEDSCLNIAVGPRGANLIMDTFGPLGMAWGTDANAFSMLAHDYFTDSNAGGSIVDPDSECQLNYVIVIGDGAMNNSAMNSDAADRVRTLRGLGVKTLFVAYGGGITGTPLQRFHDFARIGSSTATTTAQCDADPDCERAIIADTPTELKTALTSKIRQIIADKLAFTAPSITATIQEGGSIYQAQFAYEQYGEWRGTLLRKTLNADLSVDHSMDTPGNWSAAVEMKKASSGGEEEDSRNLWSAIPGAGYLGNWDNFNVDNYTPIANLFNALDYTVQDYHNSTSRCAITNSDLADEVRGLINFMKGNDYFDYDGDCDLVEVREHVMGDIYHSQLIEVGPPDASIDYRGDNEEAFYRATHGYQRFMAQYSDRRKIIYAGANSGILHAINAETGKEEWGFIPPFVGALIPQVVNPDYDGPSDTQGGTNPIFGVDGSPVVHDVFIRGYDQDGNLEGSKSWRTLLFVNYGRGGPGFSVLDITAPIPVGGRGPIHMFSVYNDKINNKVLVANHLGNITEYEYNATTSSLINSAEGSMATDNLNDARDRESSADSTDEQDQISACQEIANFRNTGTNSCYKGTVFHFPDITLPYDAGVTIPDGILAATEVIDNVPQPISISSAEMFADGENGTVLKITFDQTKTYNANAATQEVTTTTTDDEGNEVTTTTFFTDNTNNIRISACKGGADIDPEYDYTTLGETWSNPKIIRMPTGTSENIRDDRYVAVMGGGMGRADPCAGSSVFLVDLEGHEIGKPGRIFGADVNGGPITIVDTSPNGYTLGSQVIETPNGSDIANAIPASPIVITPDTAPNIPWRGALVYINDLEGKITKINLSSNTKGYSNTSDIDVGTSVVDNATNVDSGTDVTTSGLVDGVTSLYDQTTLFRLNASESNARYSFFQMEAGLGVTTGGFWLFGSTGNFTDLGGREAGLDNILYGVRDIHYPYFKHLNGVTIPKAASVSDTGAVTLNSGFTEAAHDGANSAVNHVDAETSATCVNVSGDKTGVFCPDPNAGEIAWVVHLEKVRGEEERSLVDSDGNLVTNADGTTATEMVSTNNFITTRTYRKASAPPTLFRGQVYFPIYQPPPTSNRCTQGHAFICVTDDECGTNNSDQLNLAVPEGVTVENPDVNACAYVREGVLSELVIFGDTLFANVAGPSDDESTLFSIPSIPGEIISNKGGWRDTSF